MDLERARRKAFELLNPPSPIPPEEQAPRLEGNSNQQLTSIGERIKKLPNAHIFSVEDNQETWHASVSFPATDEVPPLIANFYVMYDLGSAHDPFKRTLEAGAVWWIDGGSDEDTHPLHHETVKLFADSNEDHIYDQMCQLNLSVFEADKQAQQR